MHYAPTGMGCAQGLEHIAAGEMQRKAQHLELGLERAGRPASQTDAFTERSACVMGAASMA
jgi:hypothetical protein